MNPSRYDAAQPHLESAKASVSEGMSAASEIASQAYENAQPHLQSAKESISATTSSLVQSTVEVSQSIATSTGEFMDQKVKPAVKKAATNTEEFMEKSVKPAVSKAATNVQTAAQQAYSGAEGLAKDLAASQSNKPPTSSDI